MLRVAGLVERLEQQLGKPVTSSNHALAWHSLRLASWHDPVPPCEARPRGKARSGRGAFDLQHLPARRCRRRDRVLSYLDAGSPAHMRYTIRRLRRKPPKAKVLLACWLAEGDPQTLSDSVKADAVATSLRDVARLCLEGARAVPGADAEIPVVSAAQ